jgi:thiol-disulfide isomerase/thioredoxin
MKKFSFLAALALLLTGCGSTAPQLFTNDGKVSSCAGITTNPAKTTGTSLDCLDNNSKIILESIKGPVLINVFGSWCPPCRGEIPLLRDAYRSGKVKVIGIDVEEPSNKSGALFVEKAGITWPILQDPKSLTKSSFGMGVPVTWFLNKYGVVTHRQVGAFTSSSELSEAIGKYLG